MEYPFISVVVPVYNREDLIQNCIESLLSLEYPKDRIEIIIVDNGSSDRTPEVIQKYGVIYVLEERRGSSCARNKGVSVARGDLIAFTDSDCEVSQDWALEIANSYSKPGIAALRGFCAGINANLIATFMQRKHEGISYRRTADGYALGGNSLNPRNCAISRELFDKIGGFDPKLLRLQDFDFNRRLNLLEYKVHFNPKMVTYHHNPTDISVCLEKGESNGKDYFEIIKSRSQGLSHGILLQIRKFFLIDNLKINGLSLNLALMGIKTIRFLAFYLLKVFLFLNMDSKFAYKVFLMMFFSSREVGILKGRKRFLAGPGPAA